ncbi:phosphoribosyltransferase [bacterium]|nr:phosphoribosyltransferase [bacterium]
MPIYKDRRDAGRRLAELLVERFAGDDVVVLALVRGGLPVAIEAARALEAELDVFLVRKVGVPGNEELAAGAVASGDVEVVNDDVVGALGARREELQEVIDRERRELRRREDLYRGDREPIDVRGRIAILVDDGVATGASMAASVAALRQREPARTVVAVPVAPSRARDRLMLAADEVVCAKVEDRLPGVGAAYEAFPQVEDDEVVALLREVRGESD